MDQNSNMNQHQRWFLFSPLHTLLPIALYTQGRADKQKGCGGQKVHLQLILGQATHR